MADAAGGEVGGRPQLPFARAVGHSPKHPATYRQVTPVARQRYCPKCYIGLPTAARDKCTNCGAVLKKT